MSLKYNNTNNNTKAYNKYQNTSYNNHYGPSPPHGYKYDIYHNNINYPMKKVHQGYAHHKNAPFPAGPSSYRYPPTFGGFDDYNSYKYTKKNMQNDEKMMSSCSTGSSEEDNNNQKQRQQKVMLRQQEERDFVVYQNSAPVYDGAPTEKDTEILMYTFIGKHSDKFVCSDLKVGPKPAEAFPMPSFLD